jgi:hypothetical protein
LEERGVIALARDAPFRLQNRYKSSCQNVIAITFFIVFRR